MHWKICLAALLILFSACATNRKLPDWAKNEPLDPQYYSTVVRVSRADPEYKTQAMDTALRNISMQISVQVNANVSLRETESYGVPGSEFNSWVQASSRTNLKDIELVLFHESKKEYYAWYRISKEQYRIQRLRQKDLGVTAAIALLDKYDAAKSDPVIAIPYLLAAVDNVADFLDMDLVTSYHSKEVNIYVELLSRLRALPQSISIGLDTDTLDIVARRNTDQPARILVTGTADERARPLALFPLHCEFTAGKGEFSCPELTAVDGTADLRIKRIVDFLPEQAITISVNKAHFLQNIESAPARKLFTTLAFKPVVLHLRVSKPTITVRTWFNGTPGAKYNNLLEDKLRQLNMEVKDGTSKADYMLIVNITSKPATLIPSLNIYGATADAQLQIRDNQTGMVVTSETASSVKATGQTALLAESNTEMAAIKLFCDEYLFRIVNGTIMSGY